MAKVADVKLGWVKSPSQNAGIVSQIIEVTKNGTDVTTIEVGAEVESYVLEVSASTSVSFKVRTIDSEGNDVSSDTYSFQISDLEVPLPATGLFHEVTAIREVPDVVVDPGISE